MKKKSAASARRNQVAQDSATSPAGRLACYLTVVFSGAAVMILELLGTRIIGPFYCASLSIWSSLIAVTMIALALGYFLRGHFAAARLAQVLMFAAVSAALIPVLSRPVVAFSHLLGVRGGGFASALFLFTPLLTALAMVGPFAIRLATRHLRGSGTASGSIYAVSTLGSVAGTLLLGYQGILGPLPLPRPEARTASLIGAGGHVAVNTAIDPAVADAVRQYVGFQPAGNFLARDARYESKQLKKRYDRILHDCFTGGSRPTRPLSREMLREYAEC